VCVCVVLKGQKEGRARERRENRIFSLTTPHKKIKKIKTSSSQRVLVLGSGAFALEAAEAAAASGAAAITLVCRPGRDRWVAPFSRQLAIAAAAACPAAGWACLGLGRAVHAGLAAALNAWLARLYAACGLAALAPRPSGPRLFSGQCHDGWFRLARAGRVRVVAGAVEAVLPGGVRVGGIEADTGAACAGGGAGGSAPSTTTLDLGADVIVIALGCALNDRPAFLAGLAAEEGGGEGAGGAGLSLGDLHSFAFWGRRPRLGLACDWVWFNVPHGPKQLRDERGRGREREGKERGQKFRPPPTPS
jgi:hypothetical protein